MSFENPRVADHSIDPLFLDRWSPRAFTGEAMPHAELLRLFEAARWAPSCANAQPWRFLYAHRDTEQWPAFLGLLSPTNQKWAKDAAVLVIVASKKTRPAGDADVPSYSHSFDTGAAWANLALQAHSSGWASHGMLGFDMPRAALELRVPDDYRVEAAIAIGRRGDPSALPEGLRAREVPNERNSVDSFTFEGAFPTSG